MSLGKRVKEKKNLKITIEGPHKSGRSRLAEWLAYQLLADDVEVTVLDDDGERFDSSEIESSMEDADPQELDSVMETISRLCRVEVHVRTSRSMT